MHVHKREMVKIYRLRDMEPSAKETSSSSSSLFFIIFLLIFFSFFYIFFFLLILLNHRLLQLLYVLFINICLYIHASEIDHKDDALNFNVFPSPFMLNSPSFLAFSTHSHSQEGA